MGALFYKYEAVGNPAGDGGDREGEELEPHCVRDRILNRELKGTEAPVFIQMIRLESRANRIAGTADQHYP